MWWVAPVLAAPTVAERVAYAEAELREESRGIVLVGLGASASGRFDASHELSTEVPGAALGELAECEVATWQPVVFDCEVAVEGWPAPAARLGERVFAVRGDRILLTGIRGAGGALSVASADERTPSPEEPRIAPIGVRSDADAPSWDGDSDALDAVFAGGSTPAWSEQGDVSPEAARADIEAMMAGLADDLRRCLPSKGGASVTADFVVAQGRVAAASVEGLDGAATACVKGVLQEGQTSGVAQVRWTWTSR